MKLKFFSKEFPLVAVVLIFISLGAGALAFNYSAKAIVLINSDQALRFSYDEQPAAINLGENPAIRTTSGYDLDDYFQPIPAPTPLYSFLEEISERKEISESKVYGPDKKPSDFYGIIKVGDVVYKYDIDRTISELDNEPDIREIRAGRTAWLVSYYGPKALTMFAVSISSLSIAIALLASFKNKKGYITKRNIRLIQVCATVIGLAIVSVFAAKSLLLLGVFGTYGINRLWTDLLIGSIIPGLLCIAALLGVSHYVCQSMRDSISMKEEIDATV